MTTTPVDRAHEHRLGAPGQLSNSSMTAVELANSIAVLIQLTGSVLAVKNVLLERTKNIYSQEIQRTLSFWHGPSRVELLPIHRTKLRLKERAQVWLGASMFVLGGLTQVILPFTASLQSPISRWMGLQALLLAIVVFIFSMCVANSIARLQFRWFISTISNEQNWWNIDQFESNWDSTSLIAVADAVGHRFPSDITDFDRFESLRRCFQRPSE